MTHTSNTNKFQPIVEMPNGNTEGTGPFHFSNAERENGPTVYCFQDFMTAYGHAFDKFALIVDNGIDNNAGAVMFLNIQFHKWFYILPEVKTCEFYRVDVAKGMVSFPGNSMKQCLHRAVAFLLESVSYNDAFNREQDLIECEHYMEVRAMEDEQKARKAEAEMSASNQA